MSKLKILAVPVLVCIALTSGCVGHTPSIQPQRQNRDKSGTVAELSSVRLGGVNQSVLLRGADTTRPVLLFLHGGPGMSTMYLAHDFQRELERHFVVVQWDRRGAGKSYGARFPVESLTVRRTLADLYQLTEILRKRFHQDKIYVVAHSWGTLLGLIAVHEHPEWYLAYVGMGQLVPDTARAHALQRSCVRTEAMALGDTALSARLTVRYGSDSARVSESDMFAVGGELYRRTSMWPIIRSGLRAPEYSLVDAFHVQKGAQFVGTHMREDVDTDWMREQPTFNLPIVLFLGRHDCNTPSILAAEYLMSMDAPLKRLVWFENSAHFPFWEESQRFTEEMVRVDSIVGGTRRTFEPRP